MVRRVEGRRVLLTEEALAVFEAERQRETNERNWRSARRRWLALARGVSAPAARVSRLAAAPPSAAAVQASRDLYLAAAEHAVRAARHEKRWEEVARVRREQAAAMHMAAGSPVPPPEEIAALHREWSVAALRSLVGFGARAELVAAGCCETCDRDDGQAFRITAELHAHRLPHEGCPRGLCLCDWYPLPDAKAAKRRVRHRCVAQVPEPTVAEANAAAAPIPGSDPGSPPDPAPIAGSEAVP